MKCYLSHDIIILQTNSMWPKTPGKNKYLRFAVEIVFFNLIRRNTVRFYDQYKYSAD